MVCFILLSLTNTSYMRVALRMVLLVLFRFCHRMKGLWNGFSLSIQHTGLQKPSGGVSTAGLLLGPIL